MNNKNHHHLNLLLHDFSELPYSDAKEFIKCINYSAKTLRLLAAYKSLSEREANKFLHGINDFMFASAARKQCMRLIWLRSKDKDSIDTPVYASDKS